MPSTEELGRTPLAWSRPAAPEAEFLFPVARFLFDLRLLSTVLFPPNVGSFLHGGFGVALKAIACTLDNARCAPDVHQRTCAYAYLFETPHPPGAARMPKARAIPRPYVLEPPLAEIGRAHV